nr:MAG TPA: hypothetical protein [Caudoviricetes sp.]
MCRNCERYLLLTTRNKAPIVGINKGNKKSFRHVERI